MLLQEAGARASAVTTQRQTSAETMAAQAFAVSAPTGPANQVGEQTPNQAKVSWNDRGLEIEASNSSLDQILRQVAAATGARLEGLAQNTRKDQRVFGRYGPGPGCDVLSQLLDGSGYNVLMIGSRGTDAPRAIVLSARSPVGPQTQANFQARSHDDKASEQLKPEPPPNSLSDAPRPQPNPDPFANGSPPRDPQEFMQEILQRQQLIDQQQQQQDKPQP